jgi:cytochrome c oxidase subunit 3
LVALPQIGALKRRRGDMADAHAKKHDYHLVDPSPWPFIGALGAFVAAIGFVIYMHGSPIWTMLIGIAIIFYTMYGWWRDVIREGRRGDHTPVVQIHLRYGVILFIASEVMFFVAWFWAFFDASLFPGEAIQEARAAHTGGVWPPQGIEVFDPWHLPLINTLILLTSGTTVTWAHHALLNNDRKGLVRGLALTVLLGLVFTAVQAYEYAHAAFAFGGSIYSATFFMATGFHGFHVAIGTIFLIVCLFRSMKGDFTPKAHFGFEAAAWYWHFVDVVWIFLFFAIYVWGGYGGVIAAH